MRFEDLTLCEDCREIMLTKVSLTALLSVLSNGIDNSETEIKDKLYTDL